MPRDGIDPKSDTYARVAFGEIEASNLEHAQQLVDALMGDEESVLDLLVERGAAKEADKSKEDGLFASYGVSVGRPQVVLASELGGLDLAAHFPAEPS